MMMPYYMNQEGGNPQMYPQMGMPYIYFMPQNPVRYFNKILRTSNRSTTR